MSKSQNRDSVATRPQVRGLPPNFNGLTTPEVVNPLKFRRQPSPQPPKVPWVRATSAARQRCWGISTQSV